MKDQSKINQFLKETSEMELKKKDAFGEDIPTKTTYFHINFVETRRDFYFFMEGNYLYHGDYYSIIHENLLQRFIEEEALDWGIVEIEY